MGRLLVPRRLASRGEVVLTLTAILVQLEDHDIRALILGMGRVVAVSRRIPVLAEATTDLHDLERTARLAPLLNQNNCVGKSG